MEQQLMELSDDMTTLVNGLVASLQQLNNFILLKTAIPILGTPPTNCICGTINCSTAFHCFLLDLHEGIISPFTIVFGWAMELVWAHSAQRAHRLRVYPHSMTYFPHGIIGPVSRGSKSASVVGAGPFVLLFSVGRRRWIHGMPAQVKGE